MLKNIAKVALVSVAAVGMAMPVLAEDETTGNVTGRAYVNFSYDNTKASSNADQLTSMNMSSSARFGYTDTTKAGDWTGTAKIETSIDSEGDVGARDMYVSLANAGGTITFGRKYAWLGSTEATYAAYDGTLGHGRFTAVGYSPTIDNLSLTAFLALDQKSALLGNYSSKSGDDTLTTSDTSFGVDGTYTMDALTLGFAYASASASGDEKADANAKDWKADVSMMGLLVSYKIDDAMSAGFAYNSRSTKAGVSETVITGDGHTDIALWFEYGLGDGATVYGAYNMNDTEVVDGADAAGYTAFAVGYSTSVGGITIDVDYTSTSGTGTNEKADTNFDVTLYHYF